jgi:hypothetical protein
LFCSIAHNQVNILVHDCLHSLFSCDLINFKFSHQIYFIF